MEIEDFLRIVRSCSGYTSSTGGRNIKVLTSMDMKSKTIQEIHKCSHCGCTENNSIKINFKKIVECLTIFQAEMLYFCFEEKTT